jgi:hypothetical protein
LSAICATFYRTSKKRLQNPVFWLELSISGLKRAHTGDVAARTMQAGDEAAPDGIGATHEDDRHGRGRRLGRQGRWLATYIAKGANGAPRA